MNIIGKKQRPFIYASFISLGFWFLFIQIQNLSPIYFFLSALFLYFVLLVELFSTIYFSKKLLDQFGLPPVHSNDKVIQFIHHTFLPSLLYVSFVFFIYFNHQKHIKFLVLGLIFVTFSILFLNIRAYFEDKFKLEQNTHSIYDFIILIGMFVATDSIINTFLARQNDLYVIVFTILIFIFFATILLLRYKVFNKLYLKYIIVFTVALLALILFLLSLAFSALGSAFVITLLLYLFIAIIQHSKDKTLTLPLLIEYCVVFFLFLVLFYGIV